jgi:uncharacterized membrane protein
MASPSVDTDARPRWHAFVLVAAVMATVAGVALRAASRSDLWLDEALSVNIARLPLGDMFDALRRDGHPPLYYVLLHGWTSAFGDGDEAVRSLSGVLSVVTIPLFWVAAKRYAGTVGAVIGVVLLATNPFAIRYATEARMYALVTLLVVVGWLSVQVALERASRHALAGVAVSTGLLLLSHYWSLYLVAAVGGVLLWAWRGGRTEARRVLLAMVVGSLLFLPWLPAFLEQAGSTGTPWGLPQRPTTVLTISLTDWGGGTLNGLNGEAQLLGAGIAVLALLALFGRAMADHTVELDLRTRPHVRAEVIVIALTMALAVAAGYASSSAFASRYTAGVFPVALLVAAYGATRLPRESMQAIVIGVLAVLGLIGGIDNARTQRTQAGEIADYITANGQPGDVVAFCPDQLGPAVSRLLPDGFDQLTYPDGDAPQLVDWVDYADRIHAADPQAFAGDLDERAGDATVWLVWSGRYRTLGTSCESITDQLRRLRPGGTAVVASNDAFEHAWLFQYGPVPSP